jgi:hypothetical protein
VVHDDLNGGELLGPVASVVTEDEHNTRVPSWRSFEVYPSLVTILWETMLLLSSNEDTLGGLALALALMQSGKTAQVVVDSHTQYTRAHLAQTAANG